LPHVTRQGDDRHSYETETESVRVIILAAGQGKRLLPLTADIPKALLDIGGKTLVHRQIEAFAACGLTEFTVVTGYAASQMEKSLAGLAETLGVEIEPVFNPFYAVADNLASCWMVRHRMVGDFIQVNGDNVFRPDLVKRLLQPAEADVAVAINVKDAYDADDMKVMRDGPRLTEIGKTLPLDTVDGEAIGFYVFRGTGSTAYVAELERAMRDPSGLRHWFPSAIGSLAKKIEIGTIEMTGVEWCEVDFPVDLQGARHLVATWKTT
jgi:L-glutamine-phosphate cytidylyltransferase